ncbi:MAG: hypothetical protein AABX33_08820 [Nanoarchaeota archaeon]
MLNRRQILLILLLLSIFLAIGCNVQNISKVPSQEKNPVKSSIQSSTEEQSPKNKTIPQNPAETEIAVKPETEPECLSPEQINKDFCQENKCDVAIIVDSNIYADLIPEINQYKADLKKEFNYNVIVKDYLPSSDIKEIKSYVKSLYINGDLKGVLLIGDVPTATFFHPSVLQDSVFLSAGAPQGDFYYLDIYDKCPYSSQRDAYDYSPYECNPPKFIAPFWISRIIPPKKLKSEWASLIKNYFYRNHNYRTGQYKYDQKLLFYPPSLNDESKEYQKDTLDFIFKQLNERGIYRNDQIKLVDYTIPSGEEYLRELSKPYEFVLINAHGSSIYHQYGIISEKIINPGPMIYEIRSCSVGRFTDEDYLVGHYLFKGNSFFTIAATVPVSASSTPNFDRLLMLTNGETIFNTYRYFTVGVNWLGDPTLRMRYLERDYKEDSPKICLDKKEIDFGNVKIDRKSNIFGAGTIKIINKGKTKLKVFSDIWLKEGYYQADGTYIEELSPRQEKTLLLSVTQISVLADGKEVIPDVAQRSGKFLGEFYIMSNDPKYPVITIPFKGEVTEIIG